MVPLLVQAATSVAVVVADVVPVLVVLLLRVAALSKL